MQPTKQVIEATPLAVPDAASEPQASDQRTAGETFHTDQVLTVVGAHFLHDTFSAFLQPLLVVIKEMLGVNNTMAGLLVIITQLPSVLNPFIGYMADRVSVRYFVIFAPAVTATLMSSLGLVHSYIALAMILLATGVSIAAFHAPAPAMIARVAGNRVGTGMSLFMAGGEMGRTVGPVVVAYAVTWWGLDGIWRLAVIGWITSAVLFWRLHNVKARPGLHRQASFRGMLPQVRRIFPTLAWIMGPKALMMASLTVYLPIYMSDVKGADLTIAALSLSLLEGAGIIGALLTGTVSDLIGRKHMLLIVLTLAPILLAVFLLGPVWLAVLALIGLGLTAISPTPVLLAVVQDQFPINRATANGLYMFLNFLIRAVAIALVGMMADRLGLTPAFLISGVIALLSIPAVFRLPAQKANV